MPTQERVVVQTAQSESELVKQAKEGNAESFGRLYDSYVKRLYNFIYYRTHHKPTAEDITSLVFTKAWEKLPGFAAGKGSFSAWLYQIARNAVIDYYRAAKITEDIENAWDVSTGQDIARDTDAVLQLEKVKELLNTLPRQQREIVVMRVWDGLSHKEIADVLGITEANAKVSYSRAISKLQKDMPMVVLAAVLMKMGW